MKKGRISKSAGNRTAMGMERALQLLHHLHRIVMLDTHP
jgi:hypothetical protein